MKIKNSFSKRAQTYDSQSFIQKEVNKRLIERLDLIKHHKSKILDIGSGTGKLSQDIEEKYPGINITSMDTSFEMLQVHKKKNYNTTQPLRTCFLDNLLLIVLGSPSTVIVSVSAPSNILTSEIDSWLWTPAFIKDSFKEWYFRLSSTIDTILAGLI